MPQVPVQQFLSALQQINFATPSWDLFIALFFFVGSVIYGLAMGRQRVVMLIVAIYMDMAVVNTAPYIHDLKNVLRLGDTAAAQAVIFVGIFFLLLFLLSKTALAHSFALDEHGSWWQVLLFSMLHIGLLTSVILSYLPLTAVDHLAPLTRTIFLSDNGRFVWIIVPILAMVLFGHEKKSELI